MITIITGTPGSGKTLYTIQKLLAPLVGTHVPQEVDGVVTLHPRTIYTNINGLQLDHELIDAGGTWRFEDKEWNFYGTSGGLRDWHEWAKPGSVIVFDEVQKVWPGRANGSAVPPDIEHLETHRHMGVDFILITQGPMLIDRNLHMLCGRHLHVRRVANLPFATVYEWDLMSRTLNFKSSLRKEPYRYNRAVYKLYKSSSLHTKQVRKLPVMLWFLLAGLGVAAWKVPQVYDSLVNPVKPVVATNDKTGKAPGATKPTTTAAASPDEKVSSGEGGATSEPKKPVLAGCVRSKARCSCYDDTGKVFAPEPGTCERETAAPAVVLAGGSFPENDVYREAPQPVFVGSRTMERGRHLSELVADGARRRLN
ncbi:zonular occludens toxin domain-containing protein [Comamonas testosteroni]|uniref:zonular occludens toxin domain-containing protein n=1 Tax=Comamonas testosteroni TaxID=285 RepID=UPI002E16129A|nr:zonular occludens toxin domain-containing protein [Comamonas testosteroni]